MKYLDVITKVLLLGLFIFAITIIKAKDTAAQICTPAPSNMVSWWSGDADASDIQDGNDGVLTNGALAGFPGIVDGAFSFDGFDDFVGIPDSPNLDITNQITIDAWINPMSGPIGEIVNKFGPNSGYALRFRVDLGNIVQGQIGLGAQPGISGFPVVNSNNPIPLSQFSHVAMTYDGSTMRIYVNGVLDGFTNTVGVPIVANNVPLNIGVNQLNNSFVFFFDGLIDEVEVFNRALSQSEIQDIFSAGSAGKCAPIPPDESQACDANGSGTITAADVTALINDLRNRAPAAGNADCNDSGTVTAADVTALINVLRGRTQPPI